MAQAKYNHLVGSRVLFRSKYSVVRPDIIEFKFMECTRDHVKVQWPSGSVEWFKIVDFEEKYEFLEKLEENNHAES